MIIIIIIIMIIITIIIIIIIVIIMIIKGLKNTGSGSRAEYTHNVMKKYVRFIMSSFLTLCRKCNLNLLFIQAVL